MKRFFVCALSLALLLLPAGFAGAASLVVNLLGKYEGTANVAQTTALNLDTPIVVRILEQNGARFRGTVTFPQRDIGTMNYGGVFYEGELRISLDDGVMVGKYLSQTVNPPQIAGYYHHTGSSQSTPESGLFFLKRTSANPTAP